MSRPIDIVFDSNTTTDKDNPRYTLSPPLHNVVGYSVIWANVTFSYFTIDRLNNEFMLYMVDDKNAFTDQAFYSSKIVNTSNTINIVLYRILCRINPGTYNPITLAHELKRVFATEPIVEARRYFTVGGGAITAEDITSNYVGLAAPHNDKFAIEIDPRTNKLIFWNTVHFAPITIAVNNLDLCRILGFNSVSISTLPTNLSTMSNPSIPGVTTELSQLWRNGQLVADARTSGVYQMNNIAERTFSVTPTGGGATEDYGISAGTYLTLASLLVAINAQLGSEELTLVGGLVTFTRGTAHRIEINPLSTLLGFTATTFELVHTATNLPNPYYPYEPLSVQHLYSNNISNLTYSSLLNVHSSFSNSNLGSARFPSKIKSLLVQIPVSSNFGSYITYQPTNSECPLTRQDVYDIDFSLTLGQREIYARGPSVFDDETYQVVNFLPLNNEGFQICIRFFVDDGIRENGEST